MNEQECYTLQQLVAAIARNLLAKPLDDVAAAACGALEELGQATQVERSYIFLLNDAGCGFCLFVRPET